MSSGRFMDRPHAEKKTEVYRIYLEENNVLETITKALANIYGMEEKPANPMEFIIKELTGSLPGSTTNAAYRNAHAKAMQDLETLRKEHEAAKEEIAELKKKLDQRSGFSTPTIGSITESID